MWSHNQAASKKIGDSSFDESTSSEYLISNFGQAPPTFREEYNFNQGDNDEQGSGQYTPRLAPKHYVAGLSIQSDCVDEVLTSTQVSDKWPTASLPDVKKHPYRDPYLHGYQPRKKEDDVKTTQDSFNEVEVGEEAYEWAQKHYPYEENTSKFSRLFMCVFTTHITSSNPG